MKQRTNFCLLLVCLLQLQIIHTAYYNGYNMIREFDSDTRFSSDAASWTNYGGIYTSPVYQYCSTTLLMGGYCVLGCSTCDQTGYYFQRAYSGLPPHNSIRYVLTFWAIDSWDDNGFKLYFDGTSLDGWYMSLYTFPYQLCGSTATSWNELPMRIFGTIPHTASTLTFRLVSDLDENSCNESFGFRDISFIFDQNENTVGSTLCATADITLPNKNCNCKEGYYYTTSGCKACNSLCSSCYGASASQCYACVNSDLITYDGTKCVSCYATCATCFGGASIQCLTCISGYYYIASTRECVLYCPWPLTVSGSNCVSPCDIDTQYVAPDGTTCLSSCSSPYQTLTVHTVVKLCINPCTSVEYLYWDGSCQHDCGSPLTASRTYSNMLLCTYSCSASQYLYPDGTCGSSCDSPLVTRLTNSRYFCQSPCRSGKYLYWNGECVDTCTGYLTTSTLKSISYCNFPCATEKYLYWNGSCLTTCSHPLQIREERLRLYCDYPTATGNYLYWDGTSSSTCSSTWLSARTEGSRKFCDYTCSSESYLYWNGSCLEDCPFPLTVTVSNNIPSCVYSCTGSTYLYWNGSCFGSCDSPLTKRTEGGKSFCDYPCLNGQYLYWDGTCSFDCSGYLVTRTEGGRQFCDFPCGSSAKYLYWNGTCKSSCSFVSSTDKGEYYCNFKCSWGQYLYSDGSCLDNCDSSSGFEAWVVNDVEKYCYQISVTSYEEDCTGSFYYWNNTCGDDCKSPLVQRTVGTQKWCLYPCFTNQFLYPNSQCLDTCDLPFTVREELGYKYCDYLCDSTKYAYWNGSCLSSCDSPYRSQTTTYGLSCLLPCESSDLFYHSSTGECTEECSAPSVSADDAYAICGTTTTVVSDGSAIDLFIQGPDMPGTPSFASIPYLLQYARFLDIQMPTRLENLFASRGRNIITLRFGQYMPDEMIATYSESSIPDLFKNRKMHGEFIVNFWSELTSWAIIALVILFLALMETICLPVGRWKKAKVIFEKLKVLARWNLPIIMLSTSVGDIVFYTILEIVSIGNTSAVSVELCLVMLGLLIAVIIAAYYLVPIFVISKRKIVLHNNSDDNQTFLKKWENCQVLYRGFRDHVSPNGYFYLLYMLRIALPMFIAAVASKSPIFQVCFYVVFSLLVLSYIIIKKPVNRKINHLQLIIVETLVLVISFALLLLCIMNITNSQSSSAFTMAGDIVVYGSLIFNILLVIFFIAKLVNGVLAIKNYRHEKVKSNKNDDDDDKSTWIQLFAVYLQQGGMGFEEMFVDEKAAEIFNQRQYVLEDEKRLIELERKKIQDAKNALLNNDEQSPILNNSPRRNDRLSTFMKRSAQIEEDEVQEQQKPHGITLKPQKIEMDGREKFLNETSFEPSPHEDNPQSSPNQRVRDVFSSKFNLETQ